MLIHLGYAHPEKIREKQVMKRALYTKDGRKDDWAQLDHVSV